MPMLAYVLLLGLSMVFMLQAQPPDVEAFPERSEIPGRMTRAVRFPKAMVATAHPLASKIGREVLQAGGNAIDATVAVQMALTVVEPQSSGIGGGCFIVFYDASTGKTHCIDGREETPASARREHFINAQGKLVPEAITGCRAAGVPGTVAGMYLAHQKFGKLPWKQLLEPAIQLAESGIGVTPRLRDAITANQERFLRIPSSRKSFLEGPAGTVPEIGTVLRFPELAQTLRRIAEQGPSGFYEGETADLIVRTVQKCPIAPGSITHADLKNYQALEREPLSFFYRGYQFTGMPPPSSGTITLGIILHCLESIAPSERSPVSIEGIEAWAKAECIGFADRNAYLGDQDWNSDYDMKQLLEPVRLQERREAFRKLQPGQRAKPGPLAGKKPSQRPLNPTEGENTTHFSIVDSQRNVVSCTTTIEHGMGCGVVVEGGGFLLNNELTDFDLNQIAGPNTLDPSRREIQGRPAGKRPRS
ncbi:MAG TPA: gamma-glutamyltransferase family protein, partial [Gemmatales bacterium]|nr:gamma-glutamyltransferase family protein [Gemmatales bacterium]